MATDLEGLVARISTPSLSSFRVDLFVQPSFTVPHILQFVQSYENLRLTAVQVTFSAHEVSLYADPWCWYAPLKVRIWSRHLNWRVAFAAQIFGALSPVLSVVETVTFSYYKERNQSSELHNNVD